MVKSASPDFARQIQQSADLQRQMFSPSETPKPRREVPAPHTDAFETLHTGEDKFMLNDTFDRPEGQSQSTSSLRTFSEDAEFIDFPKNIVLYCSGEETALPQRNNLTLLNNLNYLKSCYENYKKTKEQRPSPISRDVLDSDRI